MSYSLPVFACWFDFTELLPSGNVLRTPVNHDGIWVSAKCILKLIYMFAYHEKGITSLVSVAKIKYARFLVLRIAARLGSTKSRVSCRVEALLLIYFELLPEFSIAISHLDRFRHIILSLFSVHTIWPTSIHPYSFRGELWVSLAPSPGILSLLLAQQHLPSFLWTVLPVRRSLNGGA